MVVHLSILSDILVPILVLISGLLDFFVTGTTLTFRGNILLGATGQAIENVVQIAAQVSHLLLDNF